MRVKRKRIDNLIKKLTGFRLINFKFGSFKLKNLYYHSEIASANNYQDIPSSINLYPSTSPNWDHTPRSGEAGQVIVDANPEDFYTSLEHCLERIKLNDKEEQFIFIKAWNEWAEGNYLEPDLIHGRSFLEKIRLLKKCDEKRR
jgi:hypothetical protein